MNAYYGGFDDGVFKKWDTERMVTTWTVRHRGKETEGFSSRELAMEYFNYFLNQIRVAAWTLAFCEGSNPDERADHLIDNEYERQYAYDRAKERMANDPRGWTLSLDEAMKLLS